MIFLSRICGSLCWFFFYDILVYTTNPQTHIDQLKLVLKTLRAHTLKVNLKKCSFGMTRLEYLGHIISAIGLAADPSKVKVMQEWPVPKNLKE